MTVLLMCVYTAEKGAFFVFNAESLNVKCCVPLLPPSFHKRSLMTHFLSLFPCDSLLLATFDHLAMVDYSLQLPLICRSTAVPFFTSDAYMTNRTGHFKLLEFSLVINHLDTNHCASNRAMYCWEEGALGVILSSG